VGPGKYFDKQHQRTRNLSQPNKMSQNLHFGVDLRFKQDRQQAQIPGPGTYNGDAGWNRRTYNLKFLNFKNNEGSAGKDPRNSQSPASFEKQNRSQSLQYGSSIEKNASLPTKASLNQNNSGDQAQLLNS